MEEYEFEIIQGGIVVAVASSADRDQALREIMHYAMQYAQDGQVIMRENIRPLDIPSQITPNQAGS
jgi:hypothetical protein